MHVVLKVDLYQNFYPNSYLPEALYRVALGIC